MINYSCSKCQTMLASSASLAGKVDECPVCRNKNTVPNPRVSFRKWYRASGAVVGIVVFAWVLVLVLPMLMQSVLLGTQAKPVGAISSRELPFQPSILDYKPPRIPTFTVPNIGPGSASSTTHTNTLTVENGTDAMALVRIKDRRTGVVQFEMTLEPNESQSHDITSGNYTEVVRFGRRPDEFTYSKGEGFAIDSSPGAVCQATLTLHRVREGNYQTRQCSKNEFE